MIIQRPAAALTNQGDMRFGTRSARTFPYAKYADLMVNYSVGGIRPGELCVISLTNQRLSEKTLKTVSQLYQQGYRLGINCRPEKVDHIIRTSGVNAAFEALDQSLNTQYDNVITLHDGKPSAQLTQLLQRTATSGETVKVTILTKDSDKLAEETTRQIVAQGGTPYLLGKNRHLPAIALKYGTRDDQFSFVSPESKLYASMQKLFQVSNPYDDSEDPRPKRILGDKSPKLPDTESSRRKQIGAEAAKSLRGLFMDRMRRIEQGTDLNGGFFRTMGHCPSKALAKDCGMSLNEFGRFYKTITNLHKPNVVDFYREMDQIVGHYAKQLQQFHTLRVYRADGQTDVTFSIRNPGADQSRYVAPSTATGNALPAEIFTSPVEDSVNGKLYLDLPFVVHGKSFQGIHLKFEQGKVTDLSVEKGDEALLKALVLEGVDPQKTLPGFNVLGEFAIGFNRKITELLKGRAIEDTLIAEKQDLHFALGDSYAVTGGTNHCSEHKDIPGSSGPGSGLHIEGWKNEDAAPTPIYDEGRFTEAFLQDAKGNTVRNTDFFTEA